MFYVLVIPVVIALAILSTYVKKRRIWDVLGSVTLELYALQMILGSKIVFAFYSHIQNPFLINVAVFVVIFLLAFGLRWGAGKVADFELFF